MIPLYDGPGPARERRGRADRRLGERRLVPLDVTVERRASPERRHRISRRETVGDHIRNAIQILEALLEDAQRMDVSDGRDALVASLERLRRALHEADRLAAERSFLGHTLRRTERGLPADGIPGESTPLS